MFLFHATNAIICITLTVGAIQAVIQKRYYDLICLLLLFPFFFFAFVSISLGGSVFHDAEMEYNLYQTGHYYLMSHGRYTEVTYGQYLFVMISEIVGMSSFALSFLLLMIRKIVLKAKAAR